MNLEAIMHDLAATIDVEHLTPDALGEYVLCFDDKIDVKISLLDNSTVLLIVAVTQVPSEHSAAQLLYERVLSRSLLHYRQGAKEVIAVNPDLGELQLQRTEDLGDLSRGNLQNVLENFVNAAENWVEYLNEAERSFVPSVHSHVLMP